MPSQPFSHHDILALVAPFTRAGRHVDLAATDRVERKVAFRSIDLSLESPELAGVRETLELENSDPKTYRLARLLTRADGLTARLDAAGTDPSVLLQSVESIPPPRHFQRGPGFVIARDYRLEPVAAAARREASAMVLTRATARVGSLTLILKPPTVNGDSADVELLNALDAPVHLPPDLFAVLGWAWSPLRASRDTGWRCRLRIRGSEPSRSLIAECKFEQAVVHLAKTLTETPRQFHERWVGARWRVYVRSAIPLLSCIGLIGAAAAMPRVHLAEHSTLRMLIFNAPPLLMGLFFCLREIPWIEIPPMPRRSAATAWTLPRVR